MVETSSIHNITDDRSALLKDLEARGLIHQGTDLRGLDEKLRQGPITLYAGFDPSSDSLHLGNLLPMTLLMRFAQAGHQVIGLAGGATGRIGDPSGKSSERTLLDDEILSKNLNCIYNQILQFFQKNVPATKSTSTNFRAPILVNNDDWLKEVSYLHFLRDVGKHFSVNVMLSRDSVKERLHNRDQGISYTEFSYMLLQAYDFLQLHDRYDCSLQLGASDQWGNICSGVDLIRRVRGKETFGLTTPLLLKSDGTKFGKSEKGALWLDLKKTSSYEFYQFLLQVEDSVVIDLLKRLSFLPLDQIHELEKQLSLSPESRAPQKALAENITTLVHGAEEFRKALSTSQALFAPGKAASGQEGEPPLLSLNRETLETVFRDAPSTNISPSEFQKDGGMLLIDLLVITKLANSKGQARKDIEGGGIYMNQIRSEDPQQRVSLAQLIDQEFMLLRKGKKTYHLVRARSAT